MLNFNSLNNMFNQYYKTVGELSGELFDIYRPDYITQDNTPILRYSGLRYKMGVSKAKPSAKPLVLDANLYDIFGDRSLLQSGDMIVKGSLSNPELVYPAVTISHIYAMEHIEGFRSGNLCHIVNTQDEDNSTFDYVYQNVYYDVLGAKYASGELTANYAKNGQLIPEIRAMIYTRTGLNEGQQLIETDASGTPTGNKWYIVQITPFGPYTILQLKADWRR